MTATRSPAKFFQPLAIGAPEPLRALPVRIERMIHFIPPHNSKIRAKLKDIVAQVDVVLGNPPWERIKLQEQEFFATRDPNIAEAPNKAARAHLIDNLKKTNPDLAQEFENAKHDAEADQRDFGHGIGYA